jgi:hypothetical protein
VEHVKSYKDKIVLRNSEIMYPIQLRTPLLQIELVVTTTSITISPSLGTHSLTYSLTHLTTYSLTHLR